MLGSDDIRKLLPHTWPFLWVDRVTEIELPNFIRGIKNVTLSEPHFAGHFPNQSVMPGVLIIEGVAQLAGLLVALRTIDDPETAGQGRAILAGVSKFRLRQKVVPGDQMTFCVRQQARMGDVAEFRAEVFVDGARVAEGQITLAI